MKKENLLKSIIILAGTCLSYLKYNFLLHIGFEYIGHLTIALILILLTAIYFLNRNVYGLKALTVNLKLKSLISKFMPIKQREKEGVNEVVQEQIGQSEKEKVKIEVKKSVKSTVKEVFETPKEAIKVKFSWLLEPVLWVLVTAGFAAISGFYFKTPSSVILKRAYEKNSKWQSELYLESTRSYLDFFELKYGIISYEFNWLAFYLAIISIVLIYVIIKKTTVLNIFKIKIEPYLK